jgi:4-amino-4-deoxy-L-arabinose transferase-like glycosyltransferase
MLIKPDTLLRNPVLWLLLLCAANFFVMLGAPSLWDVDEPNNAVCAREMLLAGNWWVPMFNGDYRFDKPILIYWLLMPLDALFGVNEWTARLPSAMAISGLVFVIWKMTLRLLNDQRAALMAAALFATALHVIVIAHAAVPDPLLMLALGFALPAFLIVYLEEKEQPVSSMPKLLLAAYIALGLGVLAKGPIAGLMPLLIVGAFVTLMKQWKNWRMFHPWKGVLIVMLVALPWYITVGVLTDGEWLNGFLFHHNLDRFTDSLQGHRGFPGLYVLSYLAGWFPWTGFLAAVLLFGAWRLQALREQPVRLFMLCWIGMFILFFSIARTQLPNYILPAFPAAAILMAYGWLHASAELRGRFMLYAAWTALAISLLAMIAGAVAIHKMWPGEGMYVLAMAPVTLASGWWLKRRQGEAWLSLVAGMVGCILLLTLWSLPNIDHHKVTRSMAATATASGFDGNSLATFRYFQPSLLFYHGGRLPRLDSATQVGQWLIQGKAVVMTQHALSELPKEILPYLIVHERAYGMYARKWLMLVSLRPIDGIALEDIIWQKQ